MSSLKSLKLGGVRNAIRKLLRKKSSPAVDSSGASTPAGGQLAATDDDNGGGHIHPPLPNGKSLDSPTFPYSSPDQTASNDASALSPATPSSRHNADDACNDVAAHEKPSSTPATTATTAAAVQESTGDADGNMPATTTTTTTTTVPLADQKHPHQKVQTPQRVLSDSENKENVPPGIGAEVDTEFAALKLDGTAREDGDAAQPDLSFLNDPVIAAERAEHLRFIGEALDMVSPS